MKGGFLNIISVAEFAALLADFPRLETETAPLHQAGMAVLAQDLPAREDLPLLSRSSMDGYAVRAADVFGATDGNPAYLEKDVDIAVDDHPDFQLEPGRCAGIVTGAGLPGGADAVVIVEHTQDMGGGTIEIRKSLAPGDNVMLRGEDAAEGSVGLAAGTVLRPQEIGMAAALGYPDVRIFKRPVCGLLSTGDEIIEIENAPRPGQVRDVNTHSLAAMVRECGAKAVSYGVVPDDEASLKERLEAAIAETDVVFISGGSSVGARDFTQTAVEALPEAQILAHGVAVSPGKPTILGRVGGKAVFGLPGQVASAQVVMLVFGLPFVRHISGLDNAFDPKRRVAIKARLARNTASKPGREDYVRVRLKKDGNEQIAEPVLGKSGLLKTLLAADGLMQIEADVEGIAAGDAVDVWLI